MLSIGHLSHQSTVSPEHLRELLLKIQAKLPNWLRLTADPVGWLWHYYSSLGCVSLIMGNKLFVLIPLQRKSTSEVYKIINLSIHYPEVGWKRVVVTRYKLETENIAFNVARTKCMLLTSEEDINSINLGWMYWEHVPQRAPSM